MMDLSHLAWPFFDDSHRRFAAEIDQWARKTVAQLSDHRDVDQSCRLLVRALGKAGWLRTEVQKIVIARELMKSWTAAPIRKQVWA